MSVAPAVEEATPAGAVDALRPARAQEAHRLRLGGLDWSTIADQTGYADGRVAAMAVSAYLEKVAIEQGAAFRRRALDLEFARLHALQSSYWRQAIAR